VSTEPAAAQCGLPYKDSDLYEQVAIALKVRNCLFHASGLLSWSRDEAELRRLVASREYLSREIRARVTKLGDRYEQMAIQTTPLGDQLRITNIYAHMVSGFVRDHFCDLCNRAVPLLAKRGKTTSKSPSSAPEQHRA
jgi:hypothetical protein